MNYILMAVIIYLMYFIYANRRNNEYTLKTDGRMSIDEELKKLITSRSQVLAYYKKIGMSPVLEWEMEELLGELKGNMKAEIEDYGDFLKKMEELNGGGKILKDNKGLSRYLSDNVFFKEVMDVYKDESSLIELINRNPYGNLIPFIEITPFIVKGKLIWRTPVEIKLIRKVPRDWDRFYRIIDRIEVLVLKEDPGKSLEFVKAVVTSLDRIRKSPKKRCGYYVSMINELNSQVHSWLNSSKVDNFHERKTRVNKLLLSYIQLKRDCPAEPAQWKEKGAGEISRLRRRVTGLIQRWVDGGLGIDEWSQKALMELLLNAEMGYWSAVRKAKGLVIGKIYLIRNELKEGCYYEKEIARRLRDLENENVYVNSLAFFLLSMNGKENVQRRAQFKYYERPDQKLEIRGERKND